MASGKRSVQLQGPRPSPLIINKKSRKIGKPPTAPAPSNQPPSAPVIIYDVSPKVIHVEASDFMSVVQRLTGLCSSSSSAAAEPISPAVRMAAMEKASPSWRERGMEVESEFLDMVGLEAGLMDLGQIPGILSPAPANLPVVTAGIFSSAVESQTQFGLEENMVYGNYFLPSPSSIALFSGASMLSPSPSPVFDPLRLFDS